CSAPLGFNNAEVTLAALSTTSPTFEAVFKAIASVLPAGNHLIPFCGTGGGGAPASHHLQK
ncbi:MAG: hypothetical protein ACKPKO_41685, partial [Candidatus Fonsibacter sp.]